ncbi:hypothetical protein Tco_1249598 [Tanacetum coccineum]
MGESCMLETYHEGVCGCFEVTAAMVQKGEMWSFLKPRNGLSRSCYVIKESGQQESGSTSDVHVADACNKEADEVGGNQVGNDLANKFTLSFASKLIPMYVTKVTLQKLESNVLNGADYNVWFPLASVPEVNDQMNNYIYGYFIGKRLAFPVV